MLVAALAERQLPVWSGDFIWALAYALVIGTCFAVFLWMYVLNKMPASIAGLGTMATPVMGLLFSWAQLGEQPTVLEGIGMVDHPRRLGHPVRPGVERGAAGARRAARGHDHPVRTPRAFASLGDGGDVLGRVRDLQRTLHEAHVPRLPVEADDGG